MKKDIDYEKMMYLALAKAQKKFGNTNKIKEFSDDIMKEFFINNNISDYDRNNLDNDICNIVNELVISKKYKKFIDVFNYDEIGLFVSIITNELENYIISKTL